MKTLSPSHISILQSDNNPVHAPLSFPQFVIWTFVVISMLAVIFTFFALLNVHSL